MPEAEAVKKKPTKKGKLSGRQKCAALLIALGPQQSSNVLKLLDDEHLEQAIMEIFSLERLDVDTRIAVYRDAYEMALAEEYLTSGGADYARDVLNRALGAQRTQEILERVSGGKNNPFEFIREIDPSQVMSFLQGEHPQTVALVLSHLPPSMAAGILSNLDGDLQGDVAGRVASMNRTAPDVVEAVERSLKRKLSSIASSDYAVVGGLDFLVKMLSQVDRTTEKTILQSLDGAIADEVKKQMFVFEDVAKLDDRSIQRILRDVQSADLSLALRSTSEDVRRKILSNMSTRAAQLLSEDMEAAGPVRMKQVEEAQSNIVRIVRALDEAEEIVISRGSGGDEVLV